MDEERELALLETIAVAIRLVSRIYNPLVIAISIGIALGTLAANEMERVGKHPVAVNDDR